MIYGAYGYTGALIAREAAARGTRPLLAGRDAGKVGALAAELALQGRSFVLDDPAALREGLAGLTLVLNCAGPFSATARPNSDIVRMTVSAIRSTRSWARAAIPREKSSRRFAICPVAAPWLT